MSRRHRSKGLDPASSTGTMREFVEQVQRSVSPLDKYASMGPGDFNDDDMELLQHPSGGLLGKEATLLHEARPLIGRNRALGQRPRPVTRHPLPAANPQFMEPEPSAPH